MVKERLHYLFIKTYELGLQAEERAHQDQARWILLKLVLALERYPGLRDGRKRTALMRMALFFQNLEDRWEFEHILRNIADMYGFQEMSVLPSQQNPCYLLAESYSLSSEAIRRYLANLWQDTNGAADVPSDLAIPPLQRAAQNRNAGVASAVLSHSQTVPSYTAMFNQQALHVAATCGNTQTLKELIQARVDVDARDLHQRTALSMAAANGHEECCLALLLASANPNIRDGHGHTILEAAARGGYLNIARHLVGFDAQIDTDLAFCASTALQAAIESDKLNPELVRFLIQNGADVGRPRSDGMNAIDLAEAKGLTDLADNMRQQELGIQQSFTFAASEHRQEQVYF